MKRTLLIMLVMLVLTSVMSGCAGNSAAPPEITQSDTSQTSTAENTETSGEIKVTNFDSIPLKTIKSAKEIDYQFYNPKGDGFNELVSFSHNKVLFTRDNDKELLNTGGEIRSVVKPQVFLYDIATNTADYISEYVFRNYGALSSLYMSDRYYIYATGSYTAGFDTTVFITDTKDKTTSVMAELPGHFPTFSRYGENELLYFYYYSQGDKYYQYVKIYNTETEETKVLLENIMDTSDAPEIYAVDVHNNEIYVLYHKITDEKLSTYINIYDKGGEIIKSIQDIDLGNRDKMDLGNREKAGAEYAYVSAFYVYDNTIFVKVRGMRGEYLFGFRYDGDKLSQFYGYDTSDKHLYGNSALSHGETPVSGEVDGNFLYFTDFDGEKKLVLFNLTTGEAVRFKFNIDGFFKLVDVVVDEKGDVIFKLLDSEIKYDDETGDRVEPNVKYFYLSFEQVKNM